MGEAHGRGITYVMRRHAGVGVDTRPRRARLARRGHRTKPPVVFEHGFAASFPWGDGRRHSHRPLGRVVRESCGSDTASVYSDGWW
jgi:hypothetical protein